MHLNSFFIAPLCAQLHSHLAGAWLKEAWSQERDELVLEFRLPGQEASFFLRAYMRAELTYLSFPTDFRRARANTASLFRPLYGLEVLAVQAIPYDRSFTISFLSPDGAPLQLLFKLHGNRSNVALLEGDACTALFKSALKQDLSLRPESLAQAPNLGKEAWLTVEGKPLKFLPQMGPETVTWLNLQGYSQADAAAQWALMESALATLLAPTAFYISLADGRTQLLLFPYGDVQQTHTEPMAAAQAYARAVSARFYAEAELRTATALLAKRREQTVAYLGKLAQRLHTLQEERPVSEVADAIMAQLHLFRGVAAGQPVLIEDYYTGGQLSICLKEGQTPQKHAEALYRKHKNAHQELAKLAEQQESRSTWLAQIDAAILSLPAQESIKGIRAIVASLGLVAHKEIDDEKLPYRPVFAQGWELRIGKNAVANDELLRHHSHKDDLWFHAKDVSGSHVLLVHRSGLAYPKPMMEMAAALAAYHSKKRSETLADVIMAPRKFIRKVKGTPPGAVRVEKESILLVQPQNWL